LRKYNNISSLFWLLVGLGFAWGGIRYGFGSWREPGAGFLPIVFGMLLAVLSIFLFMISLIRDPDNQKNLFGLKGGSRTRIVLTFLSLVAYTALLKKVGFIVTTFLFVFFLMKGISGKGWGLSLVVALAFSLFGYGLFSLLLGVLLPKGTLYGSAFGYLVRV
jgi:putative tricarboxylic transport membrane protein